LISISSSRANKSFVDRAWDLQYRIEDGYKKRKERKIKKRRAKIANSKWVMDLRSVKRYRKLYAIEAGIAFSIPSLLTVFFYNFLLTTLVGSYILVGCGLFAFAHTIMMLCMDYAVYKRTKGKEDWFFSDMDKLDE
jgi:Flp pilus assembly protein TadB